MGTRVYIVLFKRPHFEVNNLYKQDLEYSIVFILLFSSKSDTINVIANVAFPRVVCTTNKTCLHLVHYKCKIK